MAYSTQFHPRLISSPHSQRCSVTSTCVRNGSNPTHSYRVARSPSPGRRGTSLRVLPFDAAWGPTVDANSLAPSVFAASLFPYLGFLYHLQKANRVIAEQKDRGVEGRVRGTPPLALFGFAFLLVFVIATIPAGIYAKQHYGTSLANVDWLHLAAESLLTVTNLLIVLGMRRGIKAAEAENRVAAAAGTPTPTAAAEPAADSTRAD